MDLKIYKINNGYKIGKKDGTRLGEEYGRRYYIDKKPMRRDGAKKMLMKLQLAEQGYTMNVRSKKKRFCDGFIRIIDRKTKKRQLTPIKDFDPLTNICPDIDPDFETIFEIFLL